MHLITFRKLGDQGVPPAGELWVRPARAPGSTGPTRPALAQAVWFDKVDALQRGPGPVNRIVLDAAGVQPTFDEALAAFFAQLLLDGQDLSAGFEALARYAAMLRQGQTPTTLPMEETIEGIFLAIRFRAGTDLTDVVVAARFLEGWNRLTSRLQRAAAEQTDIFHQSLFASGSEFAEEKADLRQDRKRYKRDVRHGERWKIRVPGTKEPESGLFLNQPRSFLFPYWSRRDQATPTGEPYVFLAVSWGNGEWVFSTDPAHPEIRPTGLAAVLQGAEDRWGTLGPAVVPRQGGWLNWFRPAQRRRRRSRRTASKMTSSLVQSMSGLAVPGSSVAAPNDRVAPPWYDGRDHNYTLVATPHGGTRLPDDLVLQLVKQWTQAERFKLARPLPRWLTPVCIAAALLIVGILALVLVYTRPTDPGWSTTLFPKVAPAVVEVSTPQDRGTGFFFKDKTRGYTADGWLLTNQHVIKDARPDAKTGLIQATVRRGQLGKGSDVDFLDEGVAALIFKSDGGKDLALLKLERETPGLKWLPLAHPPAKIQTNLDCLSIGLTFKGLWLPRTGKVVKEVDLSKDYPNSSLSKMILSSCDLGSGDSGSPLVNQAGEVIGVSMAVISSGPHRSNTTEAVAAPGQVGIKLASHIHLEDLGAFLGNQPPSPPQPYVPRSPRAWLEENGLVPDPRGFISDWGNHIIAFQDKDAPQIDVGLWLHVPPTDRRVDADLAREAAGKEPWRVQFALRFGRTPTAYYDSDGDGIIDQIVQAPKPEGEREVVLPDVQWRLKAEQWIIGPAVKDRPLVSAEWFTQEKLRERFEPCVSRLNSELRKDAKLWR